jgi:neutral ceramidase
LEAEGELLAGVARSDITPPLGLRLNGTLRDDVSHGIEQSLSTTVLVLTRHPTIVVIIACDMIAISQQEATSVRETVASRLCCHASDVFLNVSHSHATPSPPSWNEFDPVAEEDQLQLAGAYHRLLVAKVAGTAEAAYGSRRPARLSSGLGSVGIGVNRREQLPDGTMVLGEDPSGITDPSVGVVRIDCADGSPLAMVVHYACHPDVLGPKSALVSPDYVGSARSVAEQVTRATTLFLQGCAGDIDPVCGIVVGEDGAREARRIGTALGCEAARVYQTLETARVRSRRVSWESAASVVTGWLYRDAPINDIPLISRSRQLRLPLRPLPGAAAAKLQLERSTAELEEVKARPHELPEFLRARRRVLWAELQLSAVDAGSPATADLEIHAVRMGDCALLGFPAEIFVEIGMQIAARSPFQTTLVSGYTNGVLFYVPTAAAHEQGGYEINSHHNYLRPSGPTPDWERLLVDAAIDLLEEIACDDSAITEEPLP